MMNTPLAIAQPYVRSENRLGEIISEQEIDSLIPKYLSSRQRYQIKRTLYCESGYHNIQSKIVKDGVRENSWGVAQINLTYNPQVSKEQALNPRFAIYFMSKHWNDIAWYGYDRKTDECNV